MTRRSKRADCCLVVAALSERCLPNPIADMEYEGKQVSLRFRQYIGNLVAAA